MVEQIIFAMATKTLVQMLDDLDGTEGAETMTFAYNGISYEIDLNDKNQAKLEKALAPFIASGRRVGRTNNRSTSTARPSRKNEGVGQFATPTQTVRDWAKENGLAVGDKGRIPIKVIEQFDTAKAGGSSNGDKPRRTRTPKAAASA